MREIIYCSIQSNYNGTVCLNSNSVQYNVIPIALTSVTFVCKVGEEVDTATSSLNFEAAAAKLIELAEEVTRIAKVKLEPC